jgi:hypothetical protein
MQQDKGDGWKSAGTARTERQASNNGTVDTLTDAMGSLTFVPRSLQIRDKVKT